MLIKKNLSVVCTYKREFSDTAKACFSSSLLSTLTKAGPFLAEAKAPSRSKLSMIAHACNKLRSVKVEIAQKKFIVSV